MKCFLKRTLPKRPETFLLGITGSDGAKNQRNLFLYATTAARVLCPQMTEGCSIYEREWKLMEDAELASLKSKIREQDESLQGWGFGEVLFSGLLLFSASLIY